MRPQIVLKSLKRVAVLAQAFALRRVIMVARMVVKVVKAVAKTDVPRLVAVAVDKDVVDHAGEDVLTLVKQFVVVIVLVPAQNLVFMDVRGGALLIVWATVVVTAQVLARADAVMDALDAPFRFLASALDFDVSD